MGDREIREKILETIVTYEPENTEKLVDLLLEKYGYNKEQVVHNLSILENQNIVKLNSGVAENENSVKDYFLSKKSTWFWLITILSIVTIITTFTITEVNSSLILLRQILGLIFLLLVPGFSLIKALFPTQGINNVERLSLSIGTSLAITPIVGLLLDYTPWGIRLETVVYAIFLVSMILSTVGLVREYNMRLRP